MNLKAGFAATFAILTAILSKSDRAPISPTVNAGQASKTETPEWMRNGLHVDVASGSRPEVLVLYRKRDQRRACASLA